jgi:predicted  nucleic acid-binding Zn-ribbon protein
MTMMVKAEKVTGALDFLENLTELSKTIPEIGDAIYSIKRMAQGIMPEIKGMVSALMNEVLFLQDKKSGVEMRLNDLKSLAAPHEKLIDELYEARNKDNTFLMRSTVEAEYATAHEDYSELKEKIDGTRSELYDINEELSMRESFRSELAACAGRVKDAGLAAEGDEAA